MTNRLAGGGGIWTGVTDQTELLAAIATAKSDGYGRIAGTPGSTFTLTAAVDMAGLVDCVIDLMGCVVNVDAVGTTYTFDFRPSLDTARGMGATTRSVEDITTDADYSGEFTEGTWVRLDHSTNSMYEYNRCRKDAVGAAVYLNWPTSHDYDAASTITPVTDGTWSENVTLRGANFEVTTAGGDHFMAYVHGYGCRFLDSHAVGVSALSMEGRNNTASRWSSIRGAQCGSMGGNDVEVSEFTFVAHPDPSVYQFGLGANIPGRGVTIRDGSIQNINRVGGAGGTRSAVYCNRKNPHVTLRALRFVDTNWGLYNDAIGPYSGGTNAVSLYGCGFDDVSIKTAGTPTYNFQPIDM